MDAATAGLVGAAIGGGVALLKSVVDGWSQHRLEKAKADWARANVVGTELRAHVANAARELLAAQHSMEWLTSHTDPGSVLTSAVVENYHTEIHSIFPKLLGALATVSSIDETAYRELAALADRVFELDSAIAGALRKFAMSPTLASSEIAELRIEATELYRELPSTIAKIMKGLRV
jgi:hypothetical protein